MPRLVKLIAVVLPQLMLGVSFASLAAQTTGSGGAAGVGGLRAYWLVFIAYSMVILLVLGWVISIGRRLKDVQERLGK